MRVLGDEDRLKALTEDFAKRMKTRSRRFHRKGKAMFVCASREIAWDFVSLKLFACLV